MSKVLICLNLPIYIFLLTATKRLSLFRIQDLFDTDFAFFLFLCADRTSGFFRNDFLSLVGHQKALADTEK